MWVKIIIVVALLAIVTSLFSGFFSLLRSSGGQRTLRALMWRVALSVSLFALLLIGFQLGFLES